MIVSLEAKGTNAYNRYTMCPAEEGWRIYQPKRCGNNNKDEDNSPKNLNDKNKQASSQKFRQLIITLLDISLKIQLKIKIEQF